MLNQNMMNFEYKYIYISKLLSNVYKNLLNVYFGYLVLFDLCDYLSSLKLIAAHFSQSYIYPTIY